MFKTPALLKLKPWWCKCFKVLHSLEEPETTEVSAYTYSSQCTYNVHVLTASYSQLPSACNQNRPWHWLIWSKTSHVCHGISGTVCAPGRHTEQDPIEGRSKERAMETLEKYVVGPKSLSSSCLS